jgi:hypothetical protein
MSSVPTGTAAHPCSSSKRARRAAKQAPRRIIPINARLRAPPLCSAISCAMRLTQRPIASLSSAAGTGEVIVGRIAVLRVRIQDKK